MSNPITAQPSVATYTLSLQSPDPSPDADSIPLLLPDAAETALTDNVAVPGEAATKKFAKGHPS